jgi:hypothetical protein
MYSTKRMNLVEVPKSLDATIGIPRLELNEAISRIIGRYTRAGHVTQWQVDQVRTLIIGNFERQFGRSNLTLWRLVQLTDRQLANYIPAVQQRLQ